MKVCLIPIVLKTYYLEPDEDVWRSLPLNVPHRLVREPLPDAVSDKTVKLVKHRTLVQKIQGKPWLGPWPVL